MINNYKKNPKPYYKYMRSKQITKPIVRQLEQDDGTLTADASETANNLHGFFFILPDILKKQITAELKYIFIRPDDVLENMKKLSKKVPGIDKIT